MKLPLKYEALGERRTLKQWMQVPWRKCPCIRLLRSRVMRNWPVDKALLAPAECADLEAFGESKPPKEWASDPRARVGGLTIFQRVYLEGWSPEMAIKTNGKTSRKLYSFFGERLTAAQITRHKACMVGFSTLRSRLQLGWAPELAATVPPGRPKYAS